MEIITREAAKASGFKRYFTNELCQRGHISERLISNAGCIACADEAARRYREKNLEKLSKKSLAHYHANRGEMIALRKARIEANPEREKLRLQKYRDANRAKIRVSSRTWRMKHWRPYYEKNRTALALQSKAYRDARPGYAAIVSNRYRARHIDRVRAASAIYYLKNTTSILQKCREYNAQNRDKRRARGGARRAKIRSSVGKVSKDIVKKLMALQRGRCACCGIKLRAGYHLDHIIPIAAGGPHEDANLQLLTPRCNLQKSAKMPHDYMRSRGFLI